MMELTGKTYDIKSLLIDAGATYRASTKSWIINDEDYAALDKKITPGYSMSIYKSWCKVKAMPIEECRCPEDSADDKIAQAFANMQGAYLDGVVAHDPYKIIMSNNPRNIAATMQRMQPSTWRKRCLDALVMLPDSPISLQDQSRIILASAPYRLAALNREVA